MIKQKLKKQQGFTVIELMIATTVFSLVLMITMAGILQVTKMYYSGVTKNKTQETARNITEELGETIRFTSAGVEFGGDPADELTGPAEVPLTATTDTDHICIGSKRYTYAIDRQLKTTLDTPPKKQKKHVLWVDEVINSCAADGPADLTLDLPSSTGAELLSENMRLVEFNVTADLPNDLYTIKVIIASGDDDLIDETTRKCKSSSGAEFCAISELSFTVEKRL